jgi:hypothetical protein
LIVTFQPAIEMQRRHCTTATAGTEALRGSPARGYADLKVLARLRESS